jgi:hypothetical protein
MRLPFVPLPCGLWRYFISDAEHLRLVGYTENGQVKYAIHHAQRLTL